LALVCTPAATVPPLIRSLGEAGTRGIVIISAGFREIGEEGRKLEKMILEKMIWKFYLKEQGLIW
jgi:acetyltransferase